MRRRTKLFLLAGCALVLALEAPRTLADLAAGWRGPYPTALAEGAPARSDAPAESVELARR